MSAEIAAGPVLPSTMWQRCASPHTSRTICKRFDQTAPPRVLVERQAARAAVAALLVRRPRIARGAAEHVPVIAGYFCV